MRDRLQQHLGRARATVRSAGRAADQAAVAAARARVHRATTGLGERGQAWWEQDEDTRRAGWEDALRDLDGD